jgi:hypothetical protein
MKYPCPKGWKYFLFPVPVKLHRRIKIDGFLKGLTITDNVVNILWGHYYKSVAPKRPDRRS